MVLLFANRTKWHMKIWSLANCSLRNMLRIFTTNLRKLRKCYCEKFRGNFDCEMCKFCIEFLQKMLYQLVCNLIISIYFVSLFILTGYQYIKHVTRTHRTWRCCILFSRVDTLLSLFSFKKCLLQNLTI